MTCATAEKGEGDTDSGWTLTSILESGMSYWVGRADKLALSNYNLSTRNLGLSHAERSHPETGNSTRANKAR